MLTAYNAKISKTPQRRIYDALVRRGYVVKSVQQWHGEYWEAEYWDTDAEGKAGVVKTPLSTLENLLRSIRRLPRKG